MAFRRGQLRAFVTVADEGQITRAAKKLRVAQPALSQTIATLEAEVGFPLFERGSRGVTLTAAGEVLLRQARLAVEAADEAMLAAESLSRSQTGTIVFGYAGLPPWQVSPHLAEAFSRAYPDIEVALQGLPFPIVPASAWLAEVDVTLVSPLTHDPAVWTEPVSAEQRAVLVGRDHRLAGEDDVSVADVLDETFVALGESVDPCWRGFWSLDDHRGGAPELVSSKASMNVQQRVGTIAVGGGVTVSSLSQAVVIQSAFPGVIAVPIRDANPVTLSLVGRQDRLNPGVLALRAVARSMRVPGDKQCGEPLAVVDLPQ